MTEDSPIFFYGVGFPFHYKARTFNFLRGDYNGSTQILYPGLIADVLIYAAVVVVLVVTISKLKKNRKK